MNVIVNGSSRSVDDGTMLDALVLDVTGGEARGCAVAIDGEVVPRSQWPSWPLADGETVEILVAVQGG